MNIELFEKDLTDLINRHSIENGSNTPDFIISKFLVGCLVSFNSSCKKRDEMSSNNKPKTDVILPKTPTETKPTGSSEVNVTPSIPTVSKLEELYIKSGGVQVRERYIDEIKKRDNL